MLGVSTSPFNIFLTRKVNFWYTVSDGNWSDPNIWISNALDKKNVLNPQVGDTVYVNHNIILDISALHVKNLFISGSIIGTASPSVAITIDGDCQVSGSGLITLQSQFHNLILNGYNNIIPYTGFNGGSYSTVTYNGNFDQFILNIPYRHLSTSGGQKYQISDISIAGNFNQQSNYEVGAYSLTVAGSTSLGTVGSYTFSKKSNLGSLLFIGSVDTEGGFDLSAGNPNVEFRGGLTIHTFLFMIGTGNVSFNTNNQTINCGYYGQTWTAPLSINGAVTVTLTGSAPFRLSSTLNGTASNSTFNNEGILYLMSNTTPMTTGVFNYQHTTSSTMGYTFNGDYTLPYVSYANLVVDGTGTKVQSGNTTIGQNLTVGINSTTSANYECNGYNLIVNGQFLNTGYFKANSYSNILFVGLANWSNGAGVGNIDLSVGNPDVEFRGGLTIHAYGVSTGTGNFKFTTNNQTIDFQLSFTGPWDANILVSGAISVMFIDGNNASQYFMNGNLNGDNANSVFINKGTLVYANAQQPMQTGKLYCNQAANTFIYGLAGNQDITVPSDPTNPGYQNLILNNSGAKKLLGNVSVKGTYILNSPAILDNNGYVLTNP